MSFGFRTGQVYTRIVDMIRSDTGLFLLHVPFREPVQKQTMSQNEIGESLPLSPWREVIQATILLGAVWLAMGLTLGLFLGLPGMVTPADWQAVEGVILVSVLGTLLAWLAAVPLSRRWFGVRIIQHPADVQELRLLMTMRDLARRAGQPVPRLGIVDAPLFNAFTLGFGRRSACIVVGRGLLEALDEETLPAILAHEMAHVLKGDLRTLTWLHAAVNVVTVQPARLVGQIVDQGLLRRDRPGIGYYLTLCLAQLSCGWLASLLSGWFSRQREFDADRTAARLVGAHTMCAALEALRRLESEQACSCPLWLNAGGFGAFLRALRGLLRTHPDLEERIQRLSRPAA